MISAIVNQWNYGNTQNQLVSAYSHPAHHTTNYTMGQFTVVVDSYNIPVYRVTALAVLKCLHPVWHCKWGRYSRDGLYIGCVFLYFALVFAYVGGIYFFLSKVINFAAKASNFITVKFMHYMRKKTRSHIQCIHSYTINLGTGQCVTDQGTREKRNEVEEIDDNENEDGNDDDDEIEVLETDELLINANGNT